MEKKIYDLLSYLKSESKGKYYLFSRAELLENCGDETGYIDKKYSDKDDMLIKPLGKSFTAKPDEKQQTGSGFGITSEKDNAFFKFFIAFLGGFSGALAGIAVFAALC